MGKHKTAGLGGIILGAGIIFMILIFMLIGTIPFQLTGTEQAILYLSAVMIMLAGLTLIITDI